MQFEITYQYSAEFVKKATWQFFLAQTKWSGIISLGILSIFGIVESFLENFRWLGGFLVGVIVIFIFQWIRYFQGTIKLATELKNNSLTVKFADDNVTFQSKDHISIVYWSRFSQVWILKDVWLFFLYSNNTYTMVPASYVAKELDTFITQKLSENKAKILRQQGKKK